MSRFRFLLFVVIFSALLYVANLVVYEALAALFLITSAPVLIAIGVLLGIFSASFIAASVLGNYYYNFFTRAYCLASMVWIGSFFYLFLASCAYGLLALVPGIPADIIGALCIAAAVLASAYGVVRARKIHVTKVTVALPNLPRAWQGRVAVFMSDLHLGQIHGPKFARRVVARVNALPHDIVFIGGDLYDGTGAPDIVELVAPLKELHAPLGVYFITGNHEEYGDRNKFIEAIARADIRVLQDEVADIDGLQLIGVEYRSASDKARFKDILSSLALDVAKSSILLKHEPKDLDVAEEAGVSLQLSGHTHEAQLWPLNYIARLMYKGFEYGLKPMGALQVYTSSGTGTWGPPMRVGTVGEIVLITFVSGVY